jgi:hypothetical protein
MRELVTMPDAEIMRELTVWTARLTLAVFLVAFVLLGKRTASFAQSLACRICGFMMALHLAALTTLASLNKEAPLSFGSPLELIVSFGGAGAALVLVIGALAWAQPWYRWLQYWAWGVFFFTYVFLPQHGQQAPRVAARPHVFGPVVATLLMALCWRAWLDWRASRTDLVDEKAA